MDDGQLPRKLRRFLNDIISFGELLSVKLSTISLEDLLAIRTSLHATTYRVQCLSERPETRLSVIRQLRGDILRFHGIKSEASAIASGTNTVTFAPTSFSKLLAAKTLGRLWKSRKPNSSDLPLESMMFRAGEGRKPSA